MTINCRWATDAIEERLDAGAAGGEGEEVAALDQLRLRLMNSNLRYLATGRRDSRASWIDPMEYSFLPFFDWHG